MLLFQNNLRSGHNDVRHLIQDADLSALLPNGRHNDPYPKIRNEHCKQPDCKKVATKMLRHSQEEMPCELAIGAWIRVSKMKDPRSRLLLAIKLLENDLSHCAQTAEKELSDPKMREVGRLRMDMVKECRRYLLFAKFRAKRPEG